MSAVFFFITKAAGHIAAGKLKKNAEAGGRHNENTVNLGKIIPDTIKY
jgi:hypothetical protein